MSPKSFSSTSKKLSSDLIYSTRCLWYHTSVTRCCPVSTGLRVLDAGLGRPVTLMKRARNSVAHRLSSVEWRVCSLIMVTQMRPPIASASIVSHTAWNASMNELMTPSYHPSGSFLSSSKESRMRRISSSPPGKSPNRSHSRALRTFWYIVDPIVTPTVPPKLLARSASPQLVSRDRRYSPNRERTTYMSPK